MKNDKRTAVLQMLGFDLLLGIFFFLFEGRRRRECAQGLCSAHTNQDHQQKPRGGACGRVVKGIL